MASANDDSFTSSFQLECLLFLLPGLTAVARTSSATLNKSGEIGHPCLLPDLEGNTCSLCPMNILRSSSIFKLIGNGELPPIPPQALYSPAVSPLF